MVIRPAADRGRVQQRDHQGIARAGSRRFAGGQRLGLCTGDLSLQKKKAVPHRAAAALLRVQSDIFLKSGCSGLFMAELELAQTDVKLHLIVLRCGSGELFEALQGFFIASLSILLHALVESR